MRGLAPGVLLCVLICSSALALERPWISDTFFYWYTWDDQREWGGWSAGVYNTPLAGYYDSPTYEDNLRSLHDAAEWGITHHFMDYWGFGWKAGDNQTPREDLLIRATEELQKRGYDTFMSIYQDGEDFDMAQFQKNLDPGRHAEFYVNRYHSSPAQPKIDGKPIYLIYGRNGAPKATATDASFRADLQARFQTIEALNQRWGTNLRSFADVKFDLSAKGWQRADAIEHQYDLWAAEMAQADRVAHERWGLPGVGFSFDVAYGPFNSSFALQPKTFCGPHSYAGIFGVPHQQDVERFIQAAVAKRYNTVFFDTFKNFYHDWEIRIPGTCYPPDFCAFDRFWVQALSHYAEALMHLSWNEWWEGSNLEPCYEYGKTFCQKNLLYSTIMKQCFQSIRNWNEGAKVAVLLNDWHWRAGGSHPEDIYACIQALRRCGVRFDLIPDDFVTPEELENFSVVIAPSGGIGFGENMRDDRIMDVLWEWAAADPARKLLVDDYPGLCDTFGLLRAGRAAGIPDRGADMNVYVDVGVEGDDKFLIDGASGREDWGKIPPDKYGATDRTFTVRWAPASGSTTSFMLPFSPNRDHVLRLFGSAIWPNHVTVLVDGAKAAEFDIKPGREAYEVAIPASAVDGLAFGELTLKYALANIPKEKDPEHYDYEGRVCNIAIDWLQLATAGTPFSTEPNYTLPEAGVQFATGAPGSLAGKTMKGPYVKHQPLAPTDRALSRYITDGAPRDILLGEGKNILYVNGLFSAIDDDAYLDSLVLNWSLGSKQGRLQPKDVIMTTLQAGDTDILLAYNYAAPETRKCLAAPSQRADAPPLVELRCLSRDGEVPEKPELAFGCAGGLFLGDDAIRFYGVYQATRGWVDLETPELALAPGETRRVGLGLKSVAGGAAAVLQGTVRVVPLLPSLTSESASFEIKPGQQITVPLAITAREDADWGQKTVVFDLEVNGRHAYFWRTLTINRLPDLRLKSPVVDSNRQVTVVSAPFPWAKDATATGLRLVRQDGAETTVGTLHPGASKQVSLGPAPGPTPSQPEYREQRARLDYRVGGVAHSKDLTYGEVAYPDAFPRFPEAIAPLLVVNPHDEYLEHFIVTHRLPQRLLSQAPLYVRESRGHVVPSQLSGENLCWLAMLPPKSVTLYYLCSGEVQQPATDLVLTEGPEGVTISNSHFTLGWSGKQGGTLTTFRSHASGHDYAAGSFGVGYGSWGKFDIKAPAINTVNFVSQEKKTWQRDLTEAAQVRLVEKGPLRAVVEVNAVGMEASQRYAVYAYQSDFAVMSSAQAPEDVDELVVMDARFARHELTKIFPNFTGIGEGFTGDHPSAGWLQAPYIPPYATLMEPERFAESLSIIPSPVGVANVNRYRHGFWPEKRPQAGPVKYAEIELVATGTRETSTSALVLMHSGHQVAAKRFRETHVEEPPTVIMPQAFSWRGEVSGGTAKLPGDWWSPYWRFALPVTVGPLDKDARDPAVTFSPDFATLLQGGPPLDPASFRAIVQGTHGVAQLPLVYDPESGQITVTLSDAAWPSPAPAVREFRLYFDTLDGAGKRVGPRAAAPVSTRLLNGGLEQGGEFWQLAGGASLASNPHTGQTCVRLDWSEGMGPVVITNSTLRIHPNSRYRVCFWAKTDSPRAMVRTNLYSGPQYDFPQFGIPISAGGEWRRYEQILPTGSFPYHINPGLRFWVMADPQTVFIDDVELEEITPGRAASAPPVKFGALIAR